MNRRPIAVLVVLIIAAAGLLVAGCGGLPGNAVAKVGDVYIDNDKFTAEVDNYATQYGISLASDPESYRDLAANVLDSLVTTELAVQKAPDLGITATDAEVQAKIDSIVTDYYEGDQSALVTDLATQSMTVDDLEKQVRDFLLAGRVRDKVVEQAPAPSDAEIAAHYEANKADYLTEQTVDARHILIAVDNRVIRGSSTTTTESTATTAEFSELSWAKALATAAQVRADLLAGGSWSRLAAKYSHDKPTKNSGGNLGTVAAGSLVEAFGQEFEDALFALTLDQVSELVKTTNGYHIIQVTKITEPQQKTLEEAKVDISAALLSAAQEEAWQTWLDKTKLEIRIVYREDMRPATTTTEAPTTTTAVPAVTTTAAPVTTTTLKP